MGDVVIPRGRVSNAGKDRFASRICQASSQPVIYSVHGAIAEHYKIDPATLKESHSSTIDYVISATAG